LTQYHWGIIGLGGIATQFAETFNQRHSRLAAVASRDLRKARQFANTHNIGKAYGSYMELLQDKEIDMVYIATPHNYHLEWILAALTHGKHVLCEKAITLTHDELAEAIETADAHNVYLAEAMTIYNMPLYDTLKKRIAANEFGKLKTIQVSFGSLKEADPENRFFNPDLAGGALLDIGTYAMSFARFFLSEQPDKLSSFMTPFSTGVDEQSVTILNNPANEMATVALNFRAKMPKRGIVAFEKAYLTIDDYPRADTAVITYPDGKTELVESGKSADALNYEIANFTQMVAGQEDNPSLRLTGDVMKLLDWMRRDWQADN